MNQDWQEKGIKKLFGDLRREDERVAPSFARVSNGRFATERRATRPALRFAIAAALLVMLIGSAVYLAKRSSKPARRDEIAVSPPALEHEKIDKIVAPAPAPEVAGIGHVQSIHRSPRRAYSEAVEISQWRAPTDFLLATPGSRLLNTVPRLGQSTSLKAIIPDSNN